MRALWAAAFLLRRLRTDAGVSLMVFGLVAVTAFLFAAAPRLFDRVADDGLRHELASARSTERNLRVAVVRPDVRRVDSVSEQFAEAMPDSLRSIVTDRGVSIRSIRFRVVEGPTLTFRNTFVTLEHHDNLADVVRLVDGRWPAAHGIPLPSPTFGFIPEDYERPPELPRFDIAISEAAADTSGLELGDVMVIDGDGTDPILDRQFAIPLLAELEVTGIFAVTDPEADTWYDDDRLQVVSFGGSQDDPIAFVTGLIAPEAYADLGASGLNFIHEWRYFVDPELLDGSEVDRLSADVQRLESLGAGGAGRGAARFSTGLPDLLEAYRAKRASSEAVLSIAAIGPLVLAGGAVGMVGILLVHRRRPTLALTRGRGASGLLLIGAQLWESLLIAGFAGLAGLAAALWLTPGRDNPASVPLVLAVVGAAVLALVAATWPVARRPLRELGEERPALRPSARRLVLEGTAVIVALGGIFLLRQRGLTLDAGGTSRFDPLLAATPALAGLAMGIVAMRLYPLPIRAFGWLAARRRDLVPVLGLRTVGRHPAAASLPLLVLMLTAAFGAFASVVTSTVDRGQIVASWENLGADYRIERLGGGSVARATEAESVPGVEAMATVYTDRQAIFATTPNQRSTILLYAIDADAYARVTAGAPIDASLPVSLGGDGPAAAGTEADPIPAVVSRRLPPASEALRSGDTFTLEIAGQVMTFVDVEERLDFPGLPPGLPFVIAPIDQIRDAYAYGTLEPNALLLRGSSDAEPRLRELVNERLGFGSVASRHAQYAALREAPLVAAVVTGFGAALLVAAAYTALAVMAALALSAAARTRDLAFLRTLGLSARQALGLTVVEHGPPVLVALIPGVALGIAVALLLSPSLGLSSFAGTDRALALTVDWGAVGAMSGGLLAVVAAAIGVSTWAARRARAADALRIGDD